MIVSVQKGDVRKETDCEQKEEIALESLPEIIRKIIREENKDLRNARVDDLQQRYFGTIPRRHLFT